MRIEYRVQSTVESEIPLPSALNQESLADSIAKHAPTDPNTPAILRSYLLGLTFPRNNISIYAKRLRFIEIFRMLSLNQFCCKIVQFLPSLLKN